MSLFARFDSKRADIFCMFLKSPPLVVYPLVNEEADPGWTFFISRWATEMKDVFSWMVRMAMNGFLHGSWMAKMSY